MEKLSTSSLTMFSVFNDKTCFSYEKVVNYLKTYALKYHDIYANQIIDLLNPFLNSSGDAVYVDYFEVKALFKIVNFIHEMNKSIYEKDKDITKENASYKSGQKDGLHMALDKFFEEFNDL